MHSSGDCLAKMRINRKLINDVIGLFSTDITYTAKDETGVTHRLRQIALCVAVCPQFCSAILRESQNVVEKLRTDFERTVKRYSRGYSFTWLVSKN